MNQHSNISALNRRNFLKTTAGLSLTLMIAPDALSLIDDAFADAPAVYIDSQLKAIVGFEFEILRLEGKRKFNQNRSVEDRIGVIEGLRELQDERKTKVADLMEEIESQQKTRDTLR